MSSDSYSKNKIMQQCKLKTKSPLINQIFKENVKFLNSKLTGCNNNSINKSYSINFINSNDEIINKSANLKNYNQK